MPKHLFGVIDTMFAPGLLLDFKRRHQQADRSGAYCGIDAMGVADNLIIHTLSARLGCAMSPMPFRAAVE